jgi:hypothetical protein
LLNVRELFTHRRAVKLKNFSFLRIFLNPLFVPFLHSRRFWPGLRRPTHLLHGLSQDVSVSFHTLTTCFCSSCREIPVYPNSDARQALFMKILSKIYRKP